MSSYHVQALCVEFPRSFIVALDLSGAYFFLALGQENLSDMILCAISRLD